MIDDGLLQEYTTSPTLNNDYVRKHNPLIQYDSVANNAQRAANIKNFTLFYQDLAANKLPQYMFITPNVGTLPRLDGDFL